MVKALKGVLLTCDPAVKQLILNLNELAGPADSFLVQDLDDTHVMVKADKVDEIRAQLTEEVLYALSV